MIHVYRTETFPSTVPDFTRVPSQKHPIGGTQPTHTQNLIKISKSQHGRYAFSPRTHASGCKAQHV